MHVFVCPDRLTLVVLELELVLVVAAARATWFGRELGAGWRVVVGRA